MAQSAATGGEQHSHAVLLDRLTTCWRVIGLTVLWLVSAAPLIIFGPATIALLAVVRDDVLGQPRPVVRSYFGYLRDNLRLGLVLGVLTVGPVVALLWLSPWGGSSVGTGLWTLALLGTVAVIPLLVHGYPMAAHTHQTVRSLYRDCVVLALARPGSTLIGLALLVAVMAATARWPIVPALVGWLAARALFVGFRRAWDATAGAATTTNRATGHVGGRQLDGLV